MVANAVQHSAEPDGLPMPARIGAVITVALAISMSVLDAVLANVALPTIADDLGTTAGSSIWIVNAYQLVTTMMLLPLASLGEIIGYRKVYLGGMILFTVMSGFCALSDTLLELSTARIFQGLGAAAVMSVNTALVRFIYPRHVLARGLAINSIVVAVCSAAGPSMAAGILAFASWPWLYAINLPLGAIALLLGLRFLPTGTRDRNRRLDKISTLLNAITFGSFFLALTGFAQGQSLTTVSLELVLCLLVGFVFIRRQLNQTAPLLPLDLLRIPLFSLSMGTSVCAFCAQMMAMVSIPFYFQRVLNLSTVETGLLMTPWPLATVIIAPIAARLVERFHAGLLGMIGMIVFATGLLLLSSLPAQPEYIPICIEMFLCGIGFGLNQSPNNHTIMTTAPPERSGGAGGMLSTARLVGQTTGAALVALAFNLLGDDGNHVALVASGTIACLAALFSGLRMRYRLIRN